MMNMPDWAIWVCTIVAILWVVRDLAMDVKKELEIKSALKEEQAMLDSMNTEEIAMVELMAEDENEAAQDVGMPEM